MHCYCWVHCCVDDTNNSHRLPAADRWLFRYYCDEYNRHSIDDRSYCSPISTHCLPTVASRLRSQFPVWPVNDIASFHWKYSGTITWWLYIIDGSKRRLGYPLFPLSPHTPPSRCIWSKISWYCNSYPAELVRRNTSFFLFPCVFLLRFALLAKGEKHPQSALCDCCRLCDVSIGASIHVFSRRCRFDRRPRRRRKLERNFWLIAV